MTHPIIGGRYEQIYARDVESHFNFWEGEMIFKIYAFDKWSGKINEVEVEKETDKMFISAPSPGYPMGQRRNKATWDIVWRRNRSEAINDGLKILTREISSLEDKLIKATWQKDALAKEAP